MPRIKNNDYHTQAQHETTSNEGTINGTKVDAKSFFFLEDVVFASK